MRELEEKLVGLKCELRQLENYQNGFFVLGDPHHIKQRIKFLELIIAYHQKEYDTANAVAQRLLTHHGLSDNREE